MNVEMLRKEYDKLTPFERAAMITRESVGLKRDSEIEALHTPTLFDALWTTAWNSNFFHVAAFAGFKAVCAEKFSLLHLANAGVFFSRFASFARLVSRRNRSTKPGCDLATNA